MNAREFFARPETWTPENLFDGVLVLGEKPSIDHQIVFVECLMMLKDLPGKVIPWMNVMFDEFNVTQLDIVYYAPDNPYQSVYGGYPFGAPSLMVELTERESLKRDHATKFLIYEKYGVREYWIVDLIARRIEVWTLKDGEYAMHGSFAPGEQFSSPLLGKDGIDPAVAFPAK